MKYKLLFLSTAFFALMLTNCKTTEKNANKIIYNDTLFSEIGNKTTINIEKGASFNHPSFVIWMEDMQGNYIKTIFITKSYASGVFGYQMVNDSTWVKNPGASFQPAALPYWTHKKGKIEGSKYIVPTPEHPFLDGFSGATPKADMEFTSSLKMGKPFKILLEVNQPWDWNKFWTNNKFPGNNDYKHSAQPSVVYAVAVNNEDKNYFMNPIGHGDPTGTTGKLFTNISTLTTAKQILKQINISVE